MADIFDEIDEELKRDRTQELWTKYGKYVIAAAAAVVLVRAAVTVTGMPLAWQCASTSATSSTDWPGSWCESKPE